MMRSARDDVRKLGSQVKSHENVVRFMTTPWREWLLNCCEMAICTLPEGQTLDEPVHCDGGASILHMSVTLFGNRRFRAEQGPELPGLYARKS